MPWYEDYFTADYWSYADAEYTAERTAAEVGYLAQVLQRHAPNRRVLDLACGVGRHAIGLAGLGFEVSGIDVSQYALDRAARAAAEAGVRLTLHRADLLGSAEWADLPGSAERVGLPGSAEWADLPGSAEWADLPGPADGGAAADRGMAGVGAAICVQAFGWGQDADQLRLLRTVRRLLAPGGLLVLDHSSILAITRMYSAHARAEIGANTFTFSRDYDPVSGRSAGQVLVERSDGTQAMLPDDIRLYTPAEVRAMLVRAGFDVIGVDADFRAGAPVTIGTRYVQFLATPAASVTSALAGHRGQPGAAEIDLRWAPDEAEFSRAAVAAAWEKVAADPLGLPDLARRYDVTDPYGGERAAAALAEHLRWPAGTVSVSTVPASTVPASTVPASDRVSVGAGVTGLLYGLARLADGGVVLAAPDGHPQLAEAATAVGGQLAVVPLTDPAAASAAVAAIGPAVTVIDRPSLTGPCWTAAMIAELAASTARAGGVLVVDESYACYLPPGDSVAPLTDSVPGLVVLRGVAKGFCCGGLRIGFAVASPGLAARVREVLAPLAGAALTLDVAIELLRRPDPLRPLRARIAQVKPTIEAAARRAGLVVVPADPHVPWIALRAEPAATATLAACGLVVKEVPVLRPTPGGVGPGGVGGGVVGGGVAGGGVAGGGEVGLCVRLARMSVPLSEQRVADVTAALTRAAGLVPRR